MATPAKEKDKIQKFVAAKERKVGVKGAAYSASADEDAASRYDVPQKKSEKHVEKIVIFGKGGIGKSTISSSLAAAYAYQGKKVLLVGCDPKHDSTISLTNGEPITTAVELPGFMDMASKKEKLVVTGELGVDCVESGGPEPGIGCAGRGISRTVEMLNQCGLMDDDSYDVMLFDVLGDVVCGGFAAPLRLGFAEKVCIVASEELMALYAANNICRAIENYASNGIGLCGIIGNMKDPEGTLLMERFARLIDTRIIATLPRDPVVRKAEFLRKNTIAYDPKTPFSLALLELADRLYNLDMKNAKCPIPLSDNEFLELSRVNFKGERQNKESGKRLPITDDDPGAAQNKAKAPVVKDDDWPDWGEPQPKRKAIEKIDPHKKVEDVMTMAEEDRLERILSTWTKAAKDGGWIEGPHGRQWGDPEQWRNFFADRETNRNYDQQTNLEAPIIGIQHEDMECHYATPHFDDGYMTWFNFKWLQRRERTVDVGEGCVGLTTDLRDTDVVSGGQGKLEEAMEIALKKTKGRAAVVLSSTCIPTVIGDDATSILKNYEKKFNIPVIYTNAAGNQDMDLLKIFFDRIKATPEFKAVRPRRESLNMIGFPPGKGREEMKELLADCGIDVHLFVLPRFNVYEVETFTAAYAHVFNPDDHLYPSYGRLFKDLDLNKIEPIAPFGITNVKKWLEAAAEAAGGSAKSAASSWSMAMEKVAARWKKRAARLKGKRCVFVVDPEKVQRLANPKGHCGVPVVMMLKEMGIVIDYAIYHPGDAPKLDSNTDKTKHGIKWFKTQEQLDELLETGSYDLAYSEFFFDKRLTRRGIAQFSLLDLEMGVQGALRSIERIDNLCRFPLYKRYARDEKIPLVR